MRVPQLSGRGATIASGGDGRQTIHDPHEVPAALQRRALLSGAVSASEYLNEALLGEGLVACQTQRRADVVKQLPHNVSSGPWLS